MTFHQPLLQTALAAAPPATERTCRFSSDATVKQVSEAIARDGYAIVENLAPELTARAARELSPYVATAPTGTGDFTGFSTQRITRLVARSEACRRLATHPLVVSTVEQLFEGSCYHPQLSLTMGVSIQPGETPQSLHRDDNVYALRHPRPPAVLNTMWAISDFTRENGATRFVPGSHRWDDERTPSEDQSVAAEMPAGSVLIWDGGLFHGGGANESDAARLGVVLAYSLGWLRQYENMYLSVPPDLAKTFSPELQQLLGYANHGFLGTYDNDDPRLWLSGKASGATPRDLYTPEMQKRRARRF